MATPRSREDRDGPPRSTRHPAAGSTGGPRGWHRHPERSSWGHDIRIQYSESTAGRARGVSVTEIDTGTETVRGEVRDRVGVVTLNRPDRRNALHPDMYDAVPRLLERFYADDEVGCVLVTAAGNAFCAGGDVRDGGRR